VSERVYVRLGVSKQKSQKSRFSDSGDLNSSHNNRQNLFVVAFTNWFDLKHCQPSCLTQHAFHTMVSTFLLGHQHSLNQRNGSIIISDIHRQQPSIVVCCWHS
jgi:hypothetical protein